MIERIVLQPDCWATLASQKNLWQWSKGGWEDSLRAVCHTEPCPTHSKSEANIWSYTCLPFKNQHHLTFTFPFSQFSHIRPLFTKHEPHFSSVSTVLSDTTFIIMSPGLYWRNWVNSHLWDLPFFPCSLNNSSDIFWSLYLPVYCLIAADPGIPFHIWWWWSHPYRVWAWVRPFPTLHYGEDKAFMGIESKLAPLLDLS